VQSQQASSRPFLPSVQSFLACFISLLKTFSFMLLLLHNNLFFIFHRFFTILHRDFIFLSKGLLVPLPLIFCTGSLPFLFLLIPVLVLIGDEEPAIYDWGVGVVSSLKSEVTKKFSQEISFFPNSSETSILISPEWKRLESTSLDLACTLSAILPILLSR
jgi:hypothetical protein